MMTSFLSWIRSCLQCGQNYWAILKIEHRVTCLAIMAYAYAACTVRVTIHSTGDKFQPVSNFTEFHALTPAAHSYVLLLNPWANDSPGCRWLDGGAGNETFPFQDTLGEFANHSYTHAREWLAMQVCGWVLYSNPLASYPSLFSLS